jgi:LytS/YehU family sensor histidine kinase
VKRTLLDIAKTYQRLQIGDSAISYARQGLAIAIAANSKPYIRDGFKILSTVYDHLGIIDSANLYFRKYISARDSVLNDQTRGRFLAYNFQQQIAALDKQKTAQQQLLQREKLNRNILIGALVIGLLLVVFLLRNMQLQRRKDQLQHLMTEANAQLENKRKEQQLSEMQQQKTGLEMQALRAQMNPHFIFNSLNSINMFILENNRMQASEYLSKFSKLVRLILQNSQETFIPLERELEALQLYLDLESVRFNNKFEYNIAVGDEIDATVLKVPPLIIQPYVENAIWHGLMHKLGHGHLNIELYNHGAFLACRITDDGIGRNRAAELRQESRVHQKPVGMKITADRIAMLHKPHQSSIAITDLVLPDGRPGGTQVTITIPYLQ